MQKNYVVTYPFALSADGCFLFIFDEESTKATLKALCRHLVILKRAEFGARCACVDGDNADLMSDCTNMGY